MTFEERLALTQTPVTLNGKRAIIMGARNRFATVAQTDSGLSCEWAWPTVARIVHNKEGRFEV